MYHPDIVETPEPTPLQYGELNISNDALSGTAMTSTAQNVMGGNYFYVIPQSVTLTTAASGSSPDITDHWVDLLVNVRASANNVQIYPASADAGKYAVTRIYIPASQTFEAGKSYTVTLNFSTGIGVSESIQSNGKLEEVYTGTLGKATVLASSNLKKVVSPEFPDDTFILGSAIDYTASVANWEAGSPVSVNGGPVIPDPEPDPVISFPAGAIPGLFTVNEDGDQVCFSQGNLQCHIDASGDPSHEEGVTWRFAEHQYDYIGNATANHSITDLSGWIDLFGWSTDHGSKPWGINISIVGADYLGDFMDWGENAIYNGASTDPANTWHTLSQSEWIYILETRTVTNSLNARYAKAKINSFKGLILFPDDWAVGNTPSLDNQAKLTASGNINGNEYNANRFNALSLTSSEWEDLEAAGCVFLPAAGERHGQSISLGEGFYWSCSLNTTNYTSAWALDFADDLMSYSFWGSFDGGYSVRLVRVIPSE